MLRFLRNLPIKRKLTFITMLTCCLALLLACLAFAVYEQVTFRATMVSDLSSTARIIGDNSSAALSFNDPASAEQTLQSLGAEPHLVAGVIYDKEGKPFARFQRAGPEGDRSFTPPLVQPDGYHFSDNRLDLFHKIDLAGEIVGVVYLQSDLREMHTRLARYGLIVLVVLGASSAAAFLIATQLQRVISEPVSQLARVAHAVASERNYSIRAVKQSEDELGRLIDGFNEMLAQIQARDADLQQAQDLLEKRVEERTHELRQEVTERQRSEQALRDTNQRFEMVTRATTDVIWDWNIESNAIWWNGHFETVFGYPAAEIGGQINSWTDRLHPEDAARVSQGIHDLIDSGDRLWSDEYRFRRHDGTYADIFDRGYVLRDATGKPIRMIGAMQDISERKRADAALRESEHRYRQLVNSLPGALYTCDAEGRITLFNQAAVALWGREPDLGADRWCGSWRILDPTTGAVIPHDRCPMAQAIREGRSVRGVEIMVERADGSRAYVLPHPDPIRDASGAVVGAVNMLVDLTERKQAEEKLEEAHRQLIEISRQAGMAEVATGVLHNVGNVLNSVNVSATLVTDQVRKSKAVNLGKAAALLREHSSDLGSFLTHDPKGRQLPGYLGQLADHLAGEQNAVIQEIESLRKNIEHIKDIVAMQQSYAKVSGIAEILDVTDLVEDSLRMNAAGLAKHDIEVVREFQNVPAVSVEKHKVLQILVNLIRNANYACNEASRPDKQVGVRVARTDNAIQIIVRDNGIGIPPENLTRIFAHGFTTKKSGHGFGLHSGALAAREMGGALRVHSDGVGHGAVFTLELPLQSQLLP